MAPSHNKLTQAAIGIEPKQAASIANGLSGLLADSFILYLKTHQFHWNVEGPQFHTLHQMFMEQYTELWNALDLIAERIRALNHYAPGSMKQYLELGQIKENAQNQHQASEMLYEALNGHELLAQRVRSLFPIAEAGQDEATIDLLTQRLQVHEKTAWMLRSLLK